MNNGSQRLNLFGQNIILAWSVPDEVYSRKVPRKLNLIWYLLFLFLQCDFI